MQLAPLLGAPSSRLQGFKCQQGLRRTHFHCIWHETSGLPVDAEAGGAISAVQAAGSVCCECSAEKRQLPSFAIFLFSRADSSVVLLIACDKSRICEPG